MEPLNKTQTVVYLVGAVLMVIGAGLSLLSWVGSPYVYSVGALCFVSMQMLQRYDGPSITVRRLRRIMFFSDFLFLATGMLMFASQGNPLGIGHVHYLMYIYQKWVVTLLLAAVLQLYVTHRIDHELEKEAKKR